MSSWCPQRDFDALKPMLLTTSRAVRDDPAWLYEVKYDGYRVLAQVAEGKVRLRTRTGSEATAWFPEVCESLAAFAGQTGTSFVLDGEMRVLDDIGRSDFEALHARAKRRGYRQGLPPVVFCVFDALALGDESLMDRPLEARKAVLRQLMTPAPERVLVVSALETEGRWLYEQALGLKLEGIVAKRKDSLYRPGERSADWVKVKRPGATPAQRFTRG